MPVLFVLSSLLSGAGAYLLVEAVAGRPPVPALLGAVLGLIVLGFVAWGRYLGCTPDEAYRRAVAPLREGRAALVIDGAGYGLPLVLGLIALAAPVVTGPALALAAALLIGGQVYAKARLILVAGQLRPVTLTLAVSKRRSS